MASLEPELVFQSGHILHGHLLVSQHGGLVLSFSMWGIRHLFYYTKPMGVQPN
jgi:hypothetical protein